MSPRIEVAGVCAMGWFSRSLSLAQWGRQRAQLERCDILLVSMVGGLQ